MVDGAVTPVFLVHECHVALAVFYLTELGAARPAHVRLLVAVVTGLPLLTRLANKINKNTF